MGSNVISYHDTYHNIFVGFASRKCLLDRESKRAVYHLPNLSDCVSEEVVQLGVLVCPILLFIFISLLELNPNPNLNLNPVVETFLVCL